MNLDFIRDIFNKSTKNNKTDEFMEELNKQSDRKISIQSRNTIRKREEEILVGTHDCVQNQEELNEAINQMKNEVLDKQDKQLEKFRKEDHLYMVEEDREGRIFLTDISDESSNIVLEEVDFPEELKDKATEGTVFIYKNKTYIFYSRSGFEIIDK